MTFVPSAIPGVNLIGSNSPEFAPAFAMAVTAAEKRDAFAPQAAVSLPRQVEMYSRSAIAVSVDAVVFDDGELAGPDAADNYTNLNVPAARWMAARELGNAARESPENLTALLNSKPLAVHRAVAKM